MKELERDLGQFERGTPTTWILVLEVPKGSGRELHRHYIHIVRTCYGSLYGGLEDFFLDMECLMTWTKDKVLKGVANQLWRLANRAARG